MVVGYTCLTLAHLALSGDLLVVTVGGVPGDLAGPQCDPYDSVGVANHQQGQEVDQHGHTDVVPVRWTEESVLERAGDHGLWAPFSVSATVQGGVHSCRMSG